VYRALFKNLVAITIILALLLSGCGKTVEIKDEEDVPEAAPSSSESNEDKDTKDTNTADDSNNDKKDDSNGDTGSFFDGIFGNKDVDNLEEIKWDKNIPDVFPENENGKCVVSNHIETDGSIWTLYYVDITEKDIEDYNDLLENNGWEQILSMEMGDVSNYTYAKDEYVISTVAGKDENNGLVYGLFFEEGLDKENIPDQDEMDEDYEEEPVDDTTVYEEQDLPDDFPKDEIPLFEDGILTASNIISTNDEIMFILDYISEKDFDDVSNEMIEVCKDRFGSNLNVVQMGEMTMISGESENYGFSILIGKTDQKDYPVNVSYSVMSSEQ